MVDPACTLAGGAFFRICAKRLIRADMVMMTDDTLYIFELKFDRSAREALEQIDKRNYPDAFILSGLPIVKVGLNFSSETRTLDGWEMVRE